MAMDDYQISDSIEIILILKAMVLSVTVGMEDNETLLSVSWIFLSNEWFWMN